MQRIRHGGVRTMGFAATTQALRRLRWNREGGRRVTLYHYTCSHAAEGIREAGGLLIPQYQPLLTTRDLVWLTDLERLDRPQQVGFNAAGKGVLTDCDRTEFRFIIPEPVDITPWETARRWYRPTIAAMLEQKRRGGSPEHWFVSESVQKVEES